MGIEAKVTLLDKMAFEGTANSGHVVILDAAEAVGGENRGFRPMELVLVGLLGCTAMDVISILRKKRQEVTGFEVRGYGERAEEHPKVYTHITLEYHVTGKQVDEKAVRRSIELSAVRYCPAQAMLRHIPMTYRYFIYEDTPEGPKKVLEGAWVPPEAGV